MRRAERSELFNLNLAINNMIVHGLLIWLVYQMAKLMFNSGYAPNIYSLYPGQMEVIPFPYIYSFVPRGLYKPPEVFPPGRDTVAEFATAHFCQVGAAIVIYIYYRENMRMMFEGTPLNWIRLFGSLFSIMGVLYFIVPFLPGVYEIENFEHKWPLPSDFFTLPFWLIIVAIINVIYYFTRVPLVETQTIYTNEES